MRRRALGITALALVILVGGGWYAKDKVEQKLSDQVVSILSDKSTQNEIQKLVKEQSNNPNVVNRVLSQVNVPGTSQTQPGSSSQPTNNQKSGKTTNVSTSISSDNASSAKGQTLQFKDRSAAVNYAMSHFTPSEIVHYMSLYAERGNLSPSEKDQIKQQILSHFTPQELAAMAAASNK